MSRDSAPSLANKVRTFDAGGHVVAAIFLGELAAFATGAGEIVLDGLDQRRRVHDGAVLCAVGDGERIVTGGDDGKLVATGADGSSGIVAERAGAWFDQVALGPDGAVAWSDGKSAFVRTKKGERALQLPSTVGGLAFAPRGLRLAIAHYNGVTLWFPNTDAKPETLEWKGSHLGARFSPDGRFLVTLMQEPALHGWRLADGQHMRMSGYPGRVRSVSFSADGDWLATAGAQELILWPFRTRDGPMGKPPLQFARGPDGVRVTVVASHPHQPALAAGYSDGRVLIVRTADGAEIEIAPPSGAAAGALAWRSDGRALAFGTEEGKAGVIDF